MDYLIRSLRDRLKKLDIEIELECNYPWVYIARINGKGVRERRGSEWGFVLGYFPVKPEIPFRFASLKETFEIIRKYNGIDS